MTSTMSPGGTRFAATCRVARGAVADVPALWSLPIGELTYCVVVDHVPSADAVRHICVDRGYDEFATVMATIVEISPEARYHGAPQESAPLNVLSSADVA